MSKITQIFRAKSKYVYRIFFGFCLVVLVATTVYWSLLAARLHQTNADQLIDSFLFENGATFHGALFPGTHTFLLKWPIFWIMQLFGDSSTVFIASTVAIVLVTVAFLIYMISRYEKRLPILGFYCLALSSVFLLIPAQPYAGALLPVNMAMTTTRNVEYIVFIAAVYIAATKLTSFKKMPFIVVTGLMTLIIASDKLFIALALGSLGVLTAWLFVRKSPRRSYVPAVVWATSIAASIVIATAGLWLLQASGLTNVTNAQMASPYPAVSGFKQIITAALYAFGSLLTNFGANPVHATTTFQNVGRDLLQSFERDQMGGYIANAGLLVFGLYAGIRLLIARRPKAVKKSLAESQLLSENRTAAVIMLIGSFVAATVVFIVTDHYYPVDARYMTIGLFALVLASASYYARKPIRRAFAVPVIVLLVVAIPTGISQAHAEYRQSEKAMASRTKMNTVVAHELEKRGVDRLIGNYWDVVPVKSAITGKLTVSPVDMCDQPRSVLNSKSWFKNQQNIPSAYLAVKDGSSLAGPDATADRPGTLPTYGGCTIQGLVGTYGAPEERVPINASTDPTQTDNATLLVYPDGVKDVKTETAAAVSKSAKLADTQAGPTNIKPAPKEGLTALNDQGDCANGTTMQVVAHQDDDILFMNPDIFKTVEAGRCIRTVYVTAGNAGEPQSYWYSRELGAKAAYAAMYDAPNMWRETSQTIVGHKISAFYLQGVPGVSLIFMHLPDGNLRGQGFAQDGYASLHSLLADKIPDIQAVDKSTTYSRQQIVDFLRTIMDVDQPDEIRTLASPNQADGDHADHHDVGILTDQASVAYTTIHTIIHYLGYPEQTRPVNLAQADVARKTSVFMAYAKFDGAVCRTIEECSRTAYGLYLNRMYKPGE